MDIGIEEIIKAEGLLNSVYEEVKTTPSWDGTLAKIELAKGFTLIADAKANICRTELAIKAEERQTKSTG